jgi:hypothetical protein
MRLLRPTVVAALVVLSAPTFATIQRTFVASNGNDANACSLTAPCRTFTRALTQTSAKGEVVVLDTAAYGPVTITQSVSIIAPPGIYAGISVFAGSDGVTVNAPGSIVVLRGLSINGQGGRFGINLHSAARLRIENCVIANMADNGIWQDAAGAELIVLDTVLRDNGGQGIGIKASASALLDHVRSEHNALDGFVIEPQLGADGNATIADSVFAYNGGTGVYINTLSPGGFPTVQIERSVISNNALAGVLCVGNDSDVFITLTRNAINRNGHPGVEVIATGVGVSCAVRMSENAILNNVGGGVLANGEAAHIFIGANTFHNTAGACEINTQNSGIVYSFGNNYGTCGLPNEITGY